MRAVRLAAAALCVLGATAAALLGHDVRSWERSIARGDAALERTPGAARWRADALVPGDAARRLTGLDDDLELRSAIRAFLVSRRTPRGFDLGERRTRARSAAEVELSNVASGAGPRHASLAENLFGVLVHGTGRAAGASSADARSLAAFETAVRLDAANEDAKYNLELLLRRARPGDGRAEPGAGSGPRGTGRRGAGAGRPGTGY